MPADEPLHKDSTTQKADSIASDRPVDKKRWPLSRLKVATLLGAAVLLVGAVVFGFIRSNFDGSNSSQSETIAEVPPPSEEEIRETSNQVAAWGTIQGKTANSVTLVTEDGRSLTLHITDKSGLFKGQWQEPGSVEELLTGVNVENAVYHAETNEVIYLWYGV